MIVSIQTDDVRIYSKSNSLRIRPWKSCMLLVIAVAHGWKPTSTQAPDPTIRRNFNLKRASELGIDLCEVGSTYNYSEIPAEDAQNMANSLMKAIAEYGSGEKDQEFYDKFHIGHMDYRNDPAEFRRTVIDVCKTFISLCADGSLLVIE